MQDEILIEPGRGFKHYWRDIWRYRELFYILAWRDILVRYKQTVIGVAWALIRPLLTMVVLTIVFLGGGKYSLDARLTKRLAGSVNSGSQAGYPP